MEPIKIVPAVLTKGFYAYGSSTFIGYGLTEDEAVADLIEKSNNRG
jgi:hypothetical protein